MNNTKYHWNGLNRMTYVKNLDAFNKLSLFMKIIIEKEIVLKHTSDNWSKLELSDFSTFTDEQFCHHGTNLKLI